MKNIHLIPNGVFAKKYIERMNKEFGEDKNDFLVYRMNNETDMVETDNIHMINKKTKNIWKRFFYLLRYDKIFLHNISYLDPRLMLLLCLVPKRLAKQYWVLWGMDLYCYQNKKESLKGKLGEVIRTVFIRNLYGIIFWVKGDYELACKWYKTKAKYFVGGYGDDNREFLHSLINNAPQKTDGLIRIQVGNSAAPMNNHIEALRKLKLIDFPNMLVYCPLSYAGTEEYIKAVINEGKALFGDRFIPITEMMTKDKYSEHLNRIDIGVFNTNRQMGLGNISTLVALGKKVYINDFTTTWEYYYRDRGINIFSFNKVDFSTESSRNEFLELLNEEQKESNYKKIVEYRALFTKYWDDIFKS